MAGKRYDVGSASSSAKTLQVNNIQKIKKNVYSQDKRSRQANERLVGVTLLVEALGTRAISITTLVGAQLSLRIGLSAMEECFLSLLHVLILTQPGIKARSLRTPVNWEVSCGN